MEKFDGVWNLSSFYSEDADRNISYPLGEESFGVLMYSKEGYMAAHLARTDGIKGNNPLLGDVVAYTGTFDVDEVHQTVTHHVISGTGQPFAASPDDPEYLTRDYKFEAGDDGIDRLWLSLVYRNLSKMQLLWARKEPYQHNTRPMKPRTIG